ncbi:MAG TPA: ATP-dependent helicase [Pyrinomonadaceae bacterium]|nr:ATP-dependent helicase [Pyrinomonadaceae bacterium]
MSHWQKIRDAAEKLRREVCAASDLNENELFSASLFLTKTAEHLELDLIPEHPESNNLSGALAVLEEDCIHFNNHLKNWYKSFCIAHEIGHFFLHHKSVHCTQAEIQDFDSEANSATEKIVGYGAGDRREREANLFALEFLLPCAVLRYFYLEQKLNSKQIAQIVEMPPEVVAGQLARAVLVPVAAKQVEKTTEKFPLNPSQKRAAETAKCPTLVYAGPGTGKTQTLTERLWHLINQGIEPKRILALTFSNKAAEEMRERIARFDEAVAAQIQVMTFHAYGLELLRAYWVEAELEPRSKLLDKIDALLYLEKNLHTLELDHYQNLHEPTQNLAAILGAISRAKDELCSPDEYEKLGKQMLADAEANDNDEVKLKAQKTLETARVYHFYENYLKTNKQLDFGDLVYRAVRLLRDNEKVKQEVRSKYEAILVDEFQDVNRACGMLLKEIAGVGRNLWAVGDLRQSIYRWRGASPANIELFETDFPNAETISLETNYRSRTEIVDLFAKFAGKMKTGGDQSFNLWEANRGAAKAENLIAVKLEIADSLDGEAANLVTKIEDYHSRGLQFKDCAVICRTHAQLNRFAKVLSAKNIPIFYLGELFERDEVRDLLSLLDLKISADSHSLIRVGAFPEYQIPLSDTRKIIAAQKENKLTFLEVIEDEDLISQISDIGKIRIEKLRKHLSSTSSEVSAWSFLSEYLFTESEYLNPFFATNDVHNQSKRLAIYQFLRLAQSLEERFSTGENLPIQELLIYIKKLAHFNEDKNYAQIPAEAENLDAVRLLTVHSAKGLEFPAVFLPFLGAGKIPSNAKAQICPNPDGMIEGNENFHESEEECLFFVAMSRARDFLHLSRAVKYGESKSNESKFLTALTDFLPPPEIIEIFETENKETELEEAEDFHPQTFYSSDLDRFLSCGRDYFYTNILGLKATGDKSIYLKFHSCVYDTISSINSIKQLENIELTEDFSIGRLHDFWTTAEVNKHPYSPIYLARAEEIIRRMCQKIKNSDYKNEITRPTYEVRLSNGAVRVRLEAVEIVENGSEKTAVIRKYKTGKSPKKPTTDDVDVLMTVAVQNNFPEAKPLLQKIYLSNDEIQEIPISAKVIENRLKNYEKAIEKIRQKRFEPSPGDNNCPHCPHYFICPSGGQDS